jgi:hypothetical protein
MAGGKSRRVKKNFAEFNIKPFSLNFCYLTQEKLPERIWKMGRG